jgi:hypothetical protein
MAKKQPFTLIFAPQVKGHLQCIDRKHHSLIREKKVNGSPWAGKRYNHE